LLRRAINDMPQGLRSAGKHMGGAGAVPAPATFFHVHRDPARFGAVPVHELMTSVAP
jgi:hypothetical protein